MEAELDGPKLPPTKVGDTKDPAWPGFGYTENGWPNVYLQVELTRLS